MDGLQIKIDDKSIRLPQQTFKPGEIITASGDSARLFHLTAGWIQESRTLARGERQIIQIWVPGDVFGFTALEQKSTVDLVGLTPGILTPLGLAANILSDDSQPFEVSQIRIAAQRNIALLADHLVSLGRFSAIERVSFALVTLHDRLNIVGLATDGVMPFPLTQVEFADHLGLSAVHLNRALKQLRSEGLYEGDRRRICLPNLERLRAIAGRTN